MYREKGTLCILWLHLWTCAKPYHTPSYNSSIESNYHKCAYFQWLTFSMAAGILLYSWCSSQHSGKNCTVDLAHMAYVDCSVFHSWWPCVMVYFITLMLLNIRYLFSSFLPLNKYNDVLLFYLLGELFLELNRDYQTAASTLYQWTVSSKIGFDSMVFGMRSHERSFQYQIPKFGWDQIQNIQAWLWRNNLKWLQCLEWNKPFALYTE